jgi:hypothetical protein
MNPHFARASIDLIIFVKKSFLQIKTNTITPKKNSEEKPKAMS